MTGARICLIVVAFATHTCVTAPLVAEKTSNGLTVHSGALVAVDYIHRTGRYRDAKGELHDFTLAPEITAKYLHSEADLRELPLGILLHFTTSEDSSNAALRPTAVEDDVTRSRRDAPTTERQREKFAEFTRARGLSGRIEQTDAGTVTVAFFSMDPERFKSVWLPEFAVGKDAKVCVANDELRTWNPPVDGERGTVTKIEEFYLDLPGSAGVRMTFKVSNMLEGFRRGRIVRVFGPGWKVQDQFYGESLMGYGFGRMLHEELRENPAKEYPDQFPFRTEFGNYSLPWYQLRAGVVPPPYSEHVVYGALTNVDGSGTAGKFAMDRTGAIGEFTLIEKAVVQALGKPAKLSDLPLGMRCRFHLYQDEQGKFTRASLVSDEFSRLASNFETYRVTMFLRGERKLYVARQIPEVKDYNGDMQRPPDIGACELRVNDQTRVWRYAQAASLDDLREGEVLRVNLSGELPGKPSICTDIWLGGEIQEPPQSAATK